MKRFVPFGVALLVAGCGINGTYPDASDSDAAKLRFASNLTSATLDYFDDAHCDGKTTGILNNLLMPNTRRRVGMLAPPPNSNKSYLEIKLKPGKDAYFRANTNGGSYVCAVAFNLVPKAGAEYELNFNGNGYFCSITLEEIEQHDSNTSRKPVPIRREPPKACEGANPLFPKKS